MKKKILLSLGAVLAVAAGVAAMSAFEAHVINVTATIENALSVSRESIEFGTVFPQENLDEDLTIGMSNSFFEEGRVDDINYVIKQKPKPREPVDGKYCYESWNYAWAAFESCAAGIGGGFIDKWEACKKELYPPSAYAYDRTKCYPYLCPFLSKLPDKPQCSDEIDNDEDGDIDSEDEECDSEEDDNEYLAGYQSDMDQGVRAPHFPDGTAEGRLAKSEYDYEDNWTIDLVVPCFQGHCAQDYKWWEFGPPLVEELEEAEFGCDLWIEVTGISED